MSDNLAVHHINYVVKNLAASVNYLSALLNQQPVYESLPLRGVDTARFELNGVWLVLVQPLSEQGEVANILKQRGEGLFLLSLATQSLDETLIQLEKKGINGSNKGPRQGLLNWLVHDLEIPSDLGPVLQLCEETEHFKNNS